MSGAPLFTLVIFMKVNNIYNIADVSVEFLLDFVLFFNLFTLASDFHEGRQLFHVDACVSILLSKERFLNLTINMQLYFITIVTSQSSFSQAPSACGVQCSTEHLVLLRQFPFFSAT